MWSIVFKWAGILWPVVWRFIRPLLEKSQLNDDLKWILPFADRMVRAVEKSFSWREKSGSEKRLAAERLIRMEMQVTDADKARRVPLSTVNLAIELALKQMAAEDRPASVGVTANGLAPAPTNAIPASAPAVEQSGAQVSP